MKFSDNQKILVGSICAYNIASLSWWAQPEIVHTLIDKTGYSASSAGLIVSIELIAVALTALVAAPWVARIPVKMTCYVAGLVAITCHLISAGTDSIVLLASARLIAGCAEGLALAIANAVLASTVNPNRSYAVLNLWNVFSGMLLLTIMPGLEQKHGQLAVFGLLAMASLLMWPLLRNIPAQLQVVAPAKISGNRKASTAVILLSMLIWGTATAMVWAFYISIGQQTRLETTTVGLIAALAAAGGLVGSGIAAYIGGKVGRYKPFYIGLLLNVIVVMTLTHVFSNWVFIITALAALACVYYLLPLYLGMAAEYDPNGGLSAAVAGVFLLSGGTGPLVGGYLVEMGGVQMIGWAVLFGASFAAASLLWLKKYASL
jgi:predicted MFS family arabinose efflux permease